MQFQDLHLPGYEHLYHNFAELEELAARYGKRFCGISLENLEAAADRLGRTSPPRFTQRTSDDYEWFAFRFVCGGGTLVLVAPRQENDGRPFLVFGEGDYVNGTDTVHDFVKKFLDAADADAFRLDAKRVAG